MIIDCISDLHGHYPKLEGGDLLIIAGDLTAKHTQEEFEQFLIWIRKQKYTEKIFIGGNHDTMIEGNHRHGRLFGDGICYLLDFGTEFEGLKIWGSPWTKTFPGMNPRCKAFTVDTDEELAKKWAIIPDDTDILVTHSPPYGSHDLVDEVTKWGTKQFNVGSPSLLKWCANHCHTLQLHVYGHIHAGYGVYDVRKEQKELGDPRTPVFVNASHVDENYRPVNNPIRIEL